METIVHYSNILVFLHLMPVLPLAVFDYSGMQDHSVVEKEEHKEVEW